MVLNGKVGVGNNDQDSRRGSRNDGVIEGSVQVEGPHGHNKRLPRAGFSTEKDVFIGFLF